MDASNNSLPNPQPTRTITNPETVGSIRRLHCRRYDDCLDIADAADWPGFSCEGCAAYEPLDGLAEKRDLRGMLELLVELRLSELTPGEPELEE